MLTLAEISCCPDIIGVGDDAAPSRALALKTGTGGDYPASPTIIDFTPITFRPAASSRSAFIFALSMAFFSKEFFISSDF